MKTIKTFSQHGIAIISAIFILVTLAALGAGALTFSTSMHVSSAQDLLSVRALQAARSGLEWGAYRQKVSSSCVALTQLATLAAPLSAPTLAPFAVTVTCESFVDGSGRPDPVTRIVSTACNEPQAGAPVGCPNITNPSANYIERQVEILF